MKKILTIIISFLVIPSSIAFAQQSVSDVLGDKEEDSLIVTEEVLEEDGDIKLKMPLQTDNPSYVITFIDPSEEEDGIQLEIDGDRYIKIDSPYTLPALGIGSHILKFKYTDEEGSSQTLERQIIIIPRAPLLNSPVIEEDSITLSGTGLANAELLLTISSGAKTYQYSTIVKENGEWTYIFTEAVSGQIYSAQGITRRYGYASNLSEVLTFEVGNIETVSSIEETSISFSFKHLDSDTINSLFRENLDLSILLLIVLSIGIGLGIFFNSMIRSRKEKRSLSSFREKINGDKEKKEEITLRELFEKENGQKNKKENTEEIKEKIKERTKKEEKDDKKEKKETKVVSKNEFLEVYKDFDPDTKEGKEKKKNPFKISLISKK